MLDQLRSGALLLCDSMQASQSNSDRNGPVWYGMEVKPYHTSSLHNNRYGLTGPTGNTTKSWVKIERG